MQRSPCPIANALDLLGDRWTLLVIRDLLMRDRRRFSEFLDGPEKISTNILSDRLSRLEAAGMIEKRARPGARHSYHPTPKGEALMPVLLSLADWSRKWLQCGD